MKSQIIMAFMVCLAFLILIPMAISIKDPITQPEVSDNSQDYQNSGEMTDAGLTIRLLSNGEVQNLTMEQYLVGAVGAEMPAAFELEALKAQAVALRTYVIYKQSFEKDRHSNADICSDSSCCAAWNSEDTLREKWGDDYDTYYSKILQAVNETDGLYLTYGGEPALAVFHSSSSGATEDSSQVWGTAMPYLISVKTPENEENVPGFVSSVTMTENEFMEVFKESYPEADFSAGLPDSIEGMIYDLSGRLSKITIGGIEISGTTLRSMYNLRSATITISFSGNDIVLTTSGYGHGVGMSQYGANVMAKSGSSFSDILAQYYPGTVLTKAEIQD